MKSLIMVTICLLFASGCVNTIMQSRSTVSNPNIQTSAYFQQSNTTPKILVDITSNESLQNVMARIKIPSLPQKEFVWNGNLIKNQSVSIEINVGKDVSGNLSVDILVDIDSDALKVNFTKVENVEVIQNATTMALNGSNQSVSQPSTHGEVGGGGGGSWDPCATPRSYQACISSTCFAADEPRKGNNFTSYFSSLNITGEYIYGMLQFDGCWGLPENEWLDRLGKDNITIYDSRGDHTFFFKAPKYILTTKSYDFVRWAGIVEDPTMKIPSDLMENVNNNPGDQVQFTLILYDTPIESQTQNMSIILNGFLIRSARTSSVFANVTQIVALANLNYVKGFEKWYSYVKD